MARDFRVELLTPSNKLISTRATDVVLPAYDGQCGILAGHNDFVGILGDGLLKITEDGKNIWFMLSKGLYQVDNEELTILAELAEGVDDIKADDAQTEVDRIEKVFADHAHYNPDDYDRLSLDLVLNKCRLEVVRLSK